MDKDKNIKIPSLSLEDVGDTDFGGGLKNEIAGSINYAFVGSGQAGSRIAEQCYKLGYKKTIVVNTSEQDLAYIDIPDNQKFLMDIGPGGAGKDIVKGEMALVKYSQEIYDMMKRIFGKTDHIMICVGAGGGSGGGSTIPLIMVIKKYLRYIGYYDDLDHRVGVIVALPTNGELLSLRVAGNAYGLLDKLSGLAEKGSITPLVIVDNERIKKIYRGLTVSKFWPTINQSVASLFDIFNQLSVQHSPYTSFDPTDYRSVITAGGHCIMGVQRLHDIVTNGAIDETKISNAIKTNLEKTLLADGFDLTSATAAASIVVGGEKMFEEVAGLQDAIEYGFDTLANMSGSATIHRGVYQDTEDSIRVYTIVGGLKRPGPRYAELKHLARDKYPS